MYATCRALLLVEVHWVHLVFPTDLLVELLLHPPEAVMIYIYIIIYIFTILHDNAQSSVGLAAVRACTAPAAEANLPALWDSSLFERFNRQRHKKKACRVS